MLFLRALPALVIADVIAVYGYCLAIAGRYPPSHPWSGIALVAIAVILLLRLRETAKLKPVAAAPSTWTAAALTAASAALWTVAAIVG